MKKFYVLALGLFTLFFTSCQFSENIYINEDGSGRMEFSFDGSGLMEMAGDEMAKDGEEIKDSTFTFKEIFDEKRDSISKLPAEEQARLKAMENFKMNMKMDPAKKELTFSMFTEFKSVNELQDMLAAMSKVQSMNKKGGEDSAMPGLEPGENTELSYSLNGNVFKRTAKITNPELHKQSMDSLGEMGMMFASSKYKLNYHFPRPIKSVSNKDAMFSEDRKTVTVEFGFMDYLSKPESLNLEVVLED